MEWTKGALKTRTSINTHHISLALLVSRRDQEVIWTIRNNCAVPTHSHAKDCMFDLALICQDLDVAVETQCHERQPSVVVGEGQDLGDLASMTIFQDNDCLIRFNIVISSGPLEDHQVVVLVHIGLVCYC